MFHHRTAWRPLLLVFVVLVVQWGGRQAPFVNEELALVRDNEDLHAWDSPWVLVAPPPREGGGWRARPLAHASLSLDTLVFGARAQSFRLVQILLQVLAAWLLFLAVRETLLRGRGLPVWCVWRGEEVAFAAALLWGLHPLTGETAVWLWNRGELLGAVCGFGMAALLAVGLQTVALRPGEEKPPEELVRGWLCLAGAWVVCLAGLAASPSFLAVPLLALLYDRAFFTKSLRRLLQARGWYYALLLLPALWPLLLWWTDTERIVAEGSGAGYGLQRLLTLFWGFGYLLQNALWPSAVAPLMPQQIDFSTVRRVVWALPAVLWALAALWGILRRPKWGFIGAATLLPWFLPALARWSPPDVLAPGWFALSLGVLMGGVVWAAFAMADRFLLKDGLLWGLLLFMAVVFGGLTVFRHTLQRDEAALWLDAASAQPYHAGARLALGRLAIEGRLPALHQAAPADLLRKASEFFAAAVAMDPSSAQACASLGNTLHRMGRIREAEQYYRAALKLDPGLGESYVHLTTLLVGEGRRREATELIENGLAVQNGTPLLLLANAEVRMQVGQPDLAGDLIAAALARAPNSADAHRLRAELLLQQGEAAAGEESLRRAAALRPSDPGMQQALARFLLARGSYAEAAEAFHRAGELDPGNLEFPLQEITCELAAGNEPRASYLISQFEQRLGGSLQIYRQLAVRLRGLGRWEAALQMAQQALHQQPDDVAMLNVVAWIQATAPEERLRSGSKALGIARRLRDSIGENDVEVLRTLAAAQAETGDFAGAARSARLALDLLGTEPGTDLLGLPEQLEAYRAGRPWREK